MGKNTHTPLCWLNISHKCAPISPGVSFCYKMYMYFIKNANLSVCVCVFNRTEEAKHPPSLISILKHNWKVAQFEYRWESYSPKPCRIVRIFNLSLFFPPSLHFHNIKLEKKKEKRKEIGSTQLQKKTHGSVFCVCTKSGYWGSKLNDVSRHVREKQGPATVDLIWGANEAGEGRGGKARLHGTEGCPLYYGFTQDSGMVWPCSQKIIAQESWGKILG